MVLPVAILGIKNGKDVSCQMQSACGCSFRMGRQEDAHEYLIALLNAMQESLLAAFQQKPALSIQETTMIFRIFAGSIRSQVCPFLPTLQALMSGSGRFVLSLTTTVNPHLAMGPLVAL